MEFITTIHGARFLAKDQYLLNGDNTVTNGITNYECRKSRSGNWCIATVSLHKSAEQLNQTAHPATKC